MMQPTTSIAPENAVHAIVARDVPTDLPLPVRTPLTDEAGAVIGYCDNYRRDGTVVTADLHWYAESQADEPHFVERQ